MEEQHGSMGTIHRMHPLLEGEHLSVRSFMHAIRKLCHSDDNAMVRHIQEQIALVQQKKPRKVRASSMFVSDAVAGAKKLLGPAGQISFDDMQVIMKGANEEFAELPEGTQQMYADWAHERGQQAVAAQSSEVSHQEQRLALHRAREMEASAGRGLMHRLSEFRYVDDDLSRMVELWNELPVEANVEQMIFQSYKSLPAPVGESKRQLKAAKPPAAATEAKSDFVRLIAGHRQFFDGMAFMVEEKEQCCCFRLLFATQSPLRAFFIILFTKSIEHPLLPTDMGLLDRVHALRDMDNFEFEWVPGTYITEKGWNVHDMNKIWVFQDLVWKGERGCSTNLKPIPLSVLANRHIIM